MNYTDTQLKQALAKMLPDCLACLENGTLIHTRLNKTAHDCKVRTWLEPVLDTELLHLCWLVEETLNYDQKGKYAYELYKLDGFYRPANSDGDTDFDELYNYIHATWQQRIIALAKVGGITI